MPAASDAVTTIVCAPSLTELTTYGLVHGTAAAPSRAQPNDVAPVEENVKLADVLLVRLGGPSRTTDPGAVASTTQVQLAAALWFERRAVDCLDLQHVLALGQRAAAERDAVDVAADECAAVEGAEEAVEAGVGRVAGDEVELRGRGAGGAGRAGQELGGLRRREVERPAERAGRAAGVAGRVHAAHLEGVRGLAGDDEVQR